MKRIENSDLEFLHAGTRDLVNLFHRLCVVAEKNTIDTEQVMFCMLVSMVKTVIAQTDENHSCEVEYKGETYRNHEDLFIAYLKKGTEFKKVHVKD